MVSIEEMENRLKNLRNRELAVFKYNKSSGFVLVYLLPLIIISVVVGVHILGAFRASRLIIILIWIIYLLNTLAIFMGSHLTRKSFLLEQDINRRRGLPFDSLPDFDVIKEALDHSMFRLSAITQIVLLSLTAYLIALIMDLLPIIFAATGMVLIALGLAIWIKPDDYTTSDALGLMDIYEPQNYPIFVDYIFTEFAQTFMDPITLTKFDEYTEELSRGIKKGMRVEQAREKIFYSIYLLSSDVISREEFRNEILEIMDERSYKKLIVEHELFGIDTLLVVMGKLKNKVPAFCKIIDRIQFNLLDNLSIFKDTEIYFDASVKNAVKGRKIEVVILLFNNKAEQKEVGVRVIAPEFEPFESHYKMKLEARDFEIKSERLPLLSSKEHDVIEYESKILDLGDVLWIPLTGKDFGEKRINVFLEDDRGNILKAVNLRINLKRDTLRGLRKVTGGGSIGAGLILPLIRILGAIPLILSRLKIL